MTMSEGSRANDELMGLKFTGSPKLQNEQVSRCQQGPTFDLQSGLTERTAQGE